MQETQRERPIHPWSRLSIRFAAILSALLLASYLVAPRLQGLGEQLLERVSPLPEPEPATEEAIWLEEELGSPYVDLLHVGVDASDLVHRLVSWSEVDETGSLRPPREAVNELSRELELYGQAFAWHDPEGRVLAASPALDLEVGDLPGDGYTAIPPRLKGEALAEPDHPNVWQMTLPVHLAGELVGSLHVFTVGRPRSGLLAPGSAEDEPTPALSPERLARRESIAATIELALFGLVGLVGSLLLSRLVTRRLSVLAEEAAVPLDQAVDHAPLPTTGRDEIAVLSRALQDLRQRARGLIASLTEQDRERRSWIALISHDLRTPLTALTACLEGAAAELEAVPPTPESAAVRDRLELAMTDAQRLRTLTDDLLDIARLDTEKALALEPVPPGELARHAAEVMQGFASQQGHRLEVEVGRGLPELDADGGRLLRALENLLRNALEFAEERVLLRVSAHERDGTSEVHFEVRDDGPGLLIGPGGEVDWDALTQRKRRPDSAGLGLTVVRRVASAHGGRLEVANGPGGGAVLTLVLPVD